MEPLYTQRLSLSTKDIQNQLRVFYKEDTNKYSNRSNVDKKLMQILKNRYKDRIFTLDKELEKNSKIKYLQVETF